MATAFTEVSISSFATLGGLCTPVARVTQRASVFAFTFPLASSFTFTVAVTSIMIVSFSFTRTEISWHHCGARIFAVTAALPGLNADMPQRILFRRVVSASTTIIYGACPSEKCSGAFCVRLVTSHLGSCLCGSLGAGSVCLGFNHNLRTRLSPSRTRLRD